MRWICAGCGTKHRSYAALAWIVWRKKPTGLGRWFDSTECKERAADA